MTEDKLFQNPRIDLSSRPYSELFFGSHLEEYASVFPEIVQKATQKAQNDGYKPDKTGEKLASNLTDQVPVEEDSVLLALIGNNHTPLVLNVLRENYNLRYYSPFSEQREFWRKMDIKAFLKEKQDYGETNLTHAARQEILEKTLDDSPEKPYAVVIGDTHGFQNDGIKYLDSAETLRQNGVKKVYVALEGFFKWEHYKIEDIGDKFPLGERSPFLPQLRQYLESLRSVEIEVELIPIEYRSKREPPHMNITNGGMFLITPGPTHHEELKGTELLEDVAKALESFESARDQLLKSIQERAEEESSDENDE